MKKQIIALLTAGSFALGGGAALAANQYLENLQAEKAKTEARAVAEIREIKTGGDKMLEERLNNFYKAEVNRMNEEVDAYLKTKKEDLHANYKMKEDAMQQDMDAINAATNKAIEEIKKAIDKEIQN
jgi:hypothetical protein